MGKPEESDCEEKVGHRAVMAKMPIENILFPLFSELWSYLESQKKLGSTLCFWHANKQGGFPFPSVSCQGVTLRGLTITSAYGEGLNSQNFSKVSQPEPQKCGLSLL